MKKVLENILEKKDKELYIRYKVIKKLLIFIGGKNNFNIDEEYMIVLLTSFLKNKKLVLDKNSFVDELACFFNKIIDLYNENEFTKYRMTLDKEVLQSESKEWLKENKYPILRIIDYYYNTVKTERREIVYKNEYFKIESVRKRYTNNYLVTVPNPLDMVVRIVLRGQIYYKDGILLSEGEYLITDKNYQLEQHKLVTKYLEMITVTLTKKFLTDFQIKSLNDIIQVKSTISLEYFRKVLNRKFIEENMSLFIEVLTLVLQVNNILPNKVIDINKIENFRIRDFLAEVERNIKLSDEEIREKVLKNFWINNTRLEELIGKYYKMTFKKYILNLKIKHIINDYYNKNGNINQLLAEYRITNNHNFYYNLKKYFGISIKTLKNRV